MNLADIAIEDLIPQRAPFVCIDALIEATDIRTVTSFFPSESHMLTENGTFSAEGLAENIAQTAAAGLGYQSLHEEGPPGIGYIAAISALRVFMLPPVGSEIRTVVEVQRQVMHVTIVLGRSFNGDELLAECEMKIFVNGD